MAGAAIPRAQQRAAKPLPLPLRDDERIGAPCACRLGAGHHDAYRHQRNGSDDRRAFAHDPVRRLDAGRGIAALPIPAQAHAIGGFGTESAAVQLLDAASIVWGEALDVRHVRKTGGRAALTICPPSIVRRREVA
jgi:hypothetical protein